MTNGSAIHPDYDPAGLTGTVAATGTGSVNFVGNKGVYFLNCCSNTNNAYYKFTGATVGSVFGMSKGQISFTLTSRYSFAQRQANAAAARYAFDVRDANGHQFYFLTEITGGRLVFTYLAGGVSAYYYVPAGSEDALFGNGVNLNVSIKWDGSTASLLLNGNTVQSAPYIPVTAYWTSTSIFDIGAYEYQTAGGYNVLDDIIGQFSVSTGVLLQIQGNSTEVAGVTNGSVVTPAAAPSGLTGKVVVNGSGSVNFVSGSGVYFLTCCSNTNNAYYAFAGSPIGNIFNIPQGQISFTLQSRYSFAQRQSNAAAARYAFDARDANGHQFYFLTEITGGRLVFTYMVQGVANYYYVPAGTENQLFGGGVTLNVTLTWNGSTANLELNGTTVKSASYIPAPQNWTSASIFDLGAYEYLTAGGYNSSDDLIREFTVALLPPNAKAASASAPKALLASAAQPAQATSASFRDGKGLSCPSNLSFGATAVCEVRLDAADASDAGPISLAASSDHVHVPAILSNLPGRSAAQFEVSADAYAPGDPVII